MKLDAVGCTPSELLGVQRDFLEKLSGPDGALWLDRAKRMLKCEVTLSAEPVELWREELISGARRRLKKFFGRRVEIDPIPVSVTPELVAKLAQYNVRLVFFPDVDISETFERKGFIKPEAWYYTNVKSGKIKGKEPTRLRRGWYGVDFSVGVDYTDGTQVFPNDPWATLISRLRGELKLVGKYDETPVGSRFSITNDEWRTVVCHAVADELGVSRELVRLERAIEFNAIGNLYDPNRGKFDIWEWFSDPFGGSHRLCGGHRRYGGLARVDYGWSDARHSYFAGRPLVSFAN